MKWPHEKNKYILAVCLFFITLAVYSQKLIPVGKGWAGNSVNTVVFRKNSIVSYKDIQYVSYYDSSGHVVIAKRKLNNDTWEIKQTPLTGNIKDAHNSISIMVDGEGSLHIAWNHHGNQLHYAKSLHPGSLEFAEQGMTGKDEQKVTYPEFYKLANGDLLFLYRDGSSGRGNLILNRYYTKTKMWHRINNNLLNGEGQRNAYWQACTDSKGSFHISWVWRETPDVYTNHDLCYARSDDGGKTWKRSNGKEYDLPITASNAEYIVRIPQGSELINSTAMSANDNGDPYIATYWNTDPSKIPQYRLIYFQDKKWNVKQVSRRTSSFVLSGAGTKKIPIARPQVLVNGHNIYIIFRDAERGNKVSVFINKDATLTSWKILDLAKIPVGQWEPSFDTELWQTKKSLDLFVQFTGQGDGERTENIESQMVTILHWDMKSKK